MKITRQWAMPNSRTFSIAPIRSLVQDTIDSLDSPAIILDPFVCDSPFADQCITNDLDPDIPADYHMDALTFVQAYKKSSCDLVLFDPPYSPRQVSECYRKLEKTVNMKTTQASFWGNLKKEIARVVRPHGLVLTCGWNSGGIGKSNGFNLERILLVPHGGWHNDTIVTIERKRGKR